MRQCGSWVMQMWTNVARLVHTRTRNMCGRTLSTFKLNLQKIPAYTYHPCDNAEFMCLQCWNSFRMHLLFWIRIGTAHTYPVLQQCRNHVIAMLNNVVAVFDNAGFMPLLPWPTLQYNNAEIVWLQCRNILQQASTMLCFGLLLQLPSLSCDNAEVG